ncbi:MAG: NUDIX domain-containing protein [Cyclobacteriaceae bacterium]
MIKNEGLSSFMNKARIRVCGILEENKSVLMIKHEGIGSAGFLWAPPGGGVEFGEKAESRLIQEFLEETGLKIKVDEFLFVNEYIDHELHAIELFFSVIKLSGELSLGTDPELSHENQIIKEIRFLSYDRLKKMPKNQVHNAFNSMKTKKSITELRGFVKFGDI